MVTEGVGSAVMVDFAAMVNSAVHLGSAETVAKVAVAAHDFAAPLRIQAAKGSCSVKCSSRPETAAAKPSTTGGSRVCCLALYLDTHDPLCKVEVEVAYGAASLDTATSSHLNFKNRLPSWSRDLNLSSLISYAGLILHELDAVRRHLPKSSATEV